MKATIRYSEAFKKQVVEEIGRGKYESASRASQAYGITGGETVRGWVKKYGSPEMQSKRIRIETMKEIDELKAARKRIKELEAALADAHIDNCLEHAFLQVACERLKVTPQDFKKKNELTLSDLRKRREIK